MGCIEQGVEQIPGFILSSCVDEKSLTNSFGSKVSRCSFLSKFVERIVAE